MPKNENRQKTHSKVTKNEIKGHSPHFWGKFALEVPFFGTPKVGASKKALPVPVRKIRDHFYKANFAQK